MTVIAGEEIRSVSRGPVAGVAEALARRRGRPAGRIYPVVQWLGALLFAAVLVTLVVSLLVSASPAFSHFGIRFLWSGTLEASQGIDGAGIFIVGTLVTTLVALVLAVPVGVGTAACLSDLAPRWLAGPLAALIDLLAAVPSVVVGLWGLLVLSPVFARDVGPFLQSIPGVRHLFGGDSLGSSVLLAGVVLAVMVLPTVVALSRTAMAGVARADREAALALGATRWQVVRGSVIPGARGGIRAALTLAIGRAMGESIAVAMVIGNRVAIPHSLLAPGATLGSQIVAQFAEATSNLARSSVIALVVVLLVVSAAVNVVGHLLLRDRARAAS